MTDLHCHIFPGVDDGAGNLSDALEMAAVAASAGVHDIAVTPHCNIPGVYRNHWGPAFDTGLELLQERLDQQKIPVRLYSGQEIFLASGYMELLEAGKLIPINGSRYVLVEFDTQERAATALGKLGQLTASGYVPIVAHPERYAFVAEDPDMPHRIKAAGGLLQVIRGSFGGRFGPAASRAALDMMDRRLVDFVSSDAHSQYSRTPYLMDEHEFVCENYSEDYGDLLFQTNPDKVLRDQTIYRY